MAFLCPVRIRRGKRKKGVLDREGMMRSVGLPIPTIGRITGSSSIETLVRVGIEKENGLSPDSKMVVLHDFTPCVDDELEVKRGQLVNVLYQENDWIYVISSDTGHEGFVPHSYCAQYGSQLAELALSVKHKKLPAQSLEHIRPGSPPIVKSSSSSSSAALTVTRTREVHSDSESYIGPHNKLSSSFTCSANGNGINIKNGLLGNSSAAAAAAGFSASGTIIGGTSGAGSNGRGCIRINSLSSTATVNSTASSPTVHPFFKDPSGRYVVLYTFIARDENDVSVERGEFVTVLNREDPDWVWITRTDGQEGFVPSAFVYPADVIPEHLNGKGQSSSLNGGGVNGNGNAADCQLNQNCGGNVVGINGKNPSGNDEDLRFHGTELVMLYDYKAQAPDDLNVRRGDWVYADLNNQTVDGWLWAFSPKTRKYGFIPKAYARPPAMTSL